MTDDRPTITPDPPTVEDLRVADEKRRAEMAEQRTRDEQASADRAARAVVIAADAELRAARLAEMAAQAQVEHATNNLAWASLPEYRRSVVFPKDFEADLEWERLVELGSYTIAGIQHPVARADIEFFVGQGGKHKKHLIVKGNTGTGKTCAAIAAGHALIRAGHHVRLVSQEKYLEEIMPEGKPRPALSAGTNLVPQSQEQFKRRVRRADVLILDDLGKGLEPGKLASRFVIEQMTSLIRDRAHMGKTTIFTTNLGARELAAMFDDRFMSSLGQDAVVAELIGPDRRKPLLDF